MAKNDDNWYENYEALKAHVAMTGHFPNKHNTLNNWVKYQRKRIKNGIMSEEQKSLFEALCKSRSNEHTGGKKKNTATFD